jgi:acylphosphatase
MRERWRIVVEGIVQGVGFRPFVYGLATTRRLAGFVRNSTTGVMIEVEGEPRALGAFLQALRQEPLALAVIARVTCEIVPPTGETAFTVANSQVAEDRRVFVPPDVCTCDDCLRELLNPCDRRYRYPFINCTNCEPRLTIIQNVPYDRERTTMAVFRMCPACQGEYEAPTNRRFHAQPNACPQCGPRLRLLDAAGGEIAGVDPTRRAAALLREGAIVAVKGLGGYHLACDASTHTVVSRLRQKKHREEKPFALMVQDMEAIQRLCEVGEAGVAIVTGDTKVVQRGHADGIFINTAGIGTIRRPIEISAGHARPGDQILLSGAVGAHGMAIMLARGDLELEVELVSDTAPLSSLVQVMLEVTPAIHCLKDPTRGGVATVLNEIARQSEVAMVIDALNELRHAS